MAHSTEADRTPSPLSPESREAEWTETKRKIIMCNNQKLSAQFIIQPLIHLRRHPAEETEKNSDRTFSGFGSKKYFSSISKNLQWRLLNLLALRWITTLQALNQSKKYLKIRKKDTRYHTASEDLKYSTCCILRYFNVYLCIGWTNIIHLLNLFWTTCGEEQVCHRPKMVKKKSNREITSTSAGVSLQFLTSMTVIMSRVASSRRFLKTFTNSSVISGPVHHTISYLT